ncbi:hypothetical protein JMJ77_0008848 [Colletotrichum scovillei]|uniref:Uncharacterized protein n=1 Tax=Colletotrichum scovillei TaxID=1209932 RepID=A0A9P7QRZ0_9PEZI|nr:hypothetical protein JMJ77_0008848 [Colletotrichum scovillei]
MPRHGRSSRDSRDGARSARIRSTWHAVKGYNSHRNPRSGNLKHCDRRENCSIASSANNSNASSSRQLSKK